MLPRLLTGIVMLSSLASQMSFAGENLWVYTKGTDTRPKSSSEFKLNDTIKVGKDSGSYTFHDVRAEFEHGITDRLTVAAEVVYYYHDYKLKDCINPMFESQGGECDDEGNVTNPGSRYSEGKFAGHELSMKYNVLSPYKDVIGLSVGLSYERRDYYRLDGAAIDQDSYSGLLFLQKDFMDDQIVTAMNVKTEFERRKSGSVLEEEISLEVSAAISYRIAPRWFVGLEFRHQSDYLNPQDKSEAGNTADGFDEDGFTADLAPSSFDLGSFKIGSRHQYGNYFGPTAHYAEKKWWVTAGVLFQISGGGSKYSYSKNGKNWDEHEEMHIGLSYGYEF